MNKKKINSIYNGKMTLEDYRVLLENFLLNDYKFVSYDNIISNKKHAIIRHDIDFIPEDALYLAKIEKNYNIKGYYFFLVNTSFYNINSNKVKKVINHLMSFGHNIGLHFDPHFSKNNLASDIKKEKILLESITQKKVEVISFHRPLKKLLNNNKKYANAMHTYMPKFFSKIGYVSDSTGEWRHGTPLENVFYLKKKAIQILIHPEWWQYKNINSKNKKIKKIYEKMQLNLTEQMKNNLSNFSISKKEFIK